MTGDQAAAVAGVAGFLGLRWAWKSFWISHHSRAAARHEAKAWKHMRGGKS